MSNDYFKQYFDKVKSADDVYKISEISLNMLETVYYNTVNYNYIGKKFIDADFGDNIKFSIVKKDWY